MIDFPDAPTVGQHCFSGGASFAWNGIRWDRAPYVSVPAATLTSLVPNTGIQGAAPVATQLIGTGFLPDSVVQVDGVTVASTYVSATEMTISVSSPVRGGPTTKSIRVLNTDITGTFPSNNLSVTYDGPRLTSVTPNVGTMNEPVTLTVRGANFVVGDQIVVAGVSYPATIVSPTEMTATVTPPYFPWTTEPPPPVPCPVGISPTLSGNQSITLTEPRFKIRSMYPDYFSSWTPLEFDVEVWGWGLLSDQSVVYLDDQACGTRMVLNAVGTEYILIFDIEPVLPANDKYVTIKVLNKGIHWSVNSWSYWCERIGLT